ncbi:hypothetical protein F5Y18DRAFT_417326 [Xylariaceae sp. FL1019]|nr:hypothetical protein F5Y18DRAFT_417326 [Xylariaceae sp. FL1019]
MDDSGSSDSDISSPDYACVSRRCGLCRFEFVKKVDTIIIYKSGGRSVIFPFDTLLVRDDDCIYTFCHHHKPNYVDECLMVIACHVECGQHGTPVSIPRLLDATAYAYDPLPAEEHRRCLRLRSGLVSTISVSLAFRLPYEICDEIARYCLRSYASRRVIAFCQKNTTVDSRIDLSKPVWTRYAVLDGLSYLVSLTNEPIPGSAMLAMPTTISAQMIYVGEDHLGVREVHFVGSLEQVPARFTQGLWWRTVQVQGRQLQVQTDGHKVRRLLCRRHKYNLLWAAPLPLNDLQHLRLVEHGMLQRSEPFRMYKLVLGDGVTGYSVCWHLNTITVKSHIEGEELYDYQNVESASKRPGALWLYMPIEPQEEVVEVWWRRDRKKRNVEGAFIFITNKRRTYLMGTYPSHWWPQRWPQYSYSLMYKAMDEGHDKPEVFLDESIVGIRAVVPDVTTVKSFGKATVYIPVPSTLLPRTFPDERYLYTAASVENVASFSICRSRAGPIIIGLLFTYNDGHRECVGQIRFDSLESPISVDISQGLWLRVARDSSGCPRVSEAGYSPMPGFEKEYISVTWQGTLEWWFSHYQCWLCCNGQSSASPHYLRRGCGLYY